MNVWAILVVMTISAPVAAGAVWIVRKASIDWTPRERVFNCASIAPTILASVVACFGFVILISDFDDRLRSIELIILQAIVGILAAFNAGLVAAFLTERWLSR